MTFHAHVYFDDATREAATRLRDRISQNFRVQFGWWCDDPASPHPEPMFQVGFGAGVFSTIVPWLMLNREGLTVLVHAETGDDLADHRDHSLWMGRMLPLRLDMFSKPLPQRNNS